MFIEELFISQNFLADLILIIHFIVVLFVFTLFFIVPVGYKLGWKWVQKKKVRFIHLLLILFITGETLIGITCPLTTLENELRGIFVSNSFIHFWISKIIFFEFPSSFFLVSYILCCGWTILMWKKFPPEIK